MAQVQLTVAGRRYRVACQDGGEARLTELAALLDAKIVEVTQSMGGLDEPRQLLFGALLLADDLVEARQAPPPPPPPPSAPAIDPALATALERLANRVEALADSASV